MSRTREAKAATRVVAEALPSAPWPVTKVDLRLCNCCGWRGRFRFAGRYDEKTCDACTAWAVRTMRAAVRRAAGYHAPVLAEAEAELYPTNRPVILVRLWPPQHAEN
jgi:hypothetical protein